MVIFAIAGSVRADSSNSAVLRAASAHAGDGQMIVFENLRDVPPFDASIPDDQQPPAVDEMRKQIAQADGLLVVTPEYAHSMPGVLKNALDWLVGSGELASKPVAIITVSTTPTGGLRAQTALVQTLLAQSAEIVALLPIAGSRMKIDEAGNVIHTPTMRRIKETVTALLEHCEELSQHMRR